MKRMNLMAAVVTMLASAVSVFAVGGVLPDGQGTNWSYGDLYGQGSYTLRNWKTANTDGSGVTNIPIAGVVGLATTNNAMGTSIAALNDSTNSLNTAVTDLRTATNALDAAVTDLKTATNSLNEIVVELNTNALRLTGGTMNGNVDLNGNTFSNGTFIGDGTGLTGVTAVVGDNVLQTNDTPQSKAGLLTLSGGATVAAKLTLTPSATQTLATDANVEPDAAMVAVAGDGGAVTCGMNDGTAAGQLLTIRGTSDANSVQLTNAAVVPTFTLGNNDLASFVWTGVGWVEQWRRDN